MRVQELKKLEAPLPEGATADDAHRALLDELDVRCPSVDALVQELLSRLQPPSPDKREWTRTDQRRVLVADHVFACAGAVSNNLADAVIHFWELLHQWEIIGKKHLRVLTVDGAVEPPAPRTVGAFLPEWRAAQELAGVFGSIASTLDCLAATIIGVFELPLNLVKASFGGVFDWLTTDDKRARQRTFAQTEFGTWLNDVFQAVGPEDWRQWCLDYRHTLVHRARRTEMRQGSVEHVLYDASGNAIPRVNQTVLLLRDADLSNTEALVQFARYHITLTEPADVSLRGLIDSATKLVDRVAARLLQETRSRPADDRSEPLAKQWPSVRFKPSHRFEGYAPNTVVVRGTQMAVSPVDFARFQAVAAHRPELWRPDVDETDEP